MQKPELLGLVASTVLRRNDCIACHIIACIKAGASNEELYKTLSIALVVGGSITIPHICCAFDMLDDARQAEKEDQG